MDLLYQTHSPYARKVLVFAHEAGLAGQLRVIHHETSPTNRNDQVFAVNPLGKVPVLVLSDGETIFDSVVICDYLETLNRQTSLIPATGPRRWAALRMQAVAQGMCEAGIALRWETSRRPEHLRYLALAEGMKTKLVESYDYLEQSTEFDEPLHVGHIAVASALDWLAFRNLPAFEQGRPRLSKWFRAFLQRPSMRATVYDGETHD
ncbi:glutathione S-transferase family protein [Mesorhizobium sp. NPDC059054]|uniref:glutathione S-transferase family protein n=1 Tax=Mesorhizobium sp. NPDC059054 TaxID=3346711 RepID=UPI0036A4F4DA